MLNSIDEIKNINRKEHINENIESEEEEVDYGYDEANEEKLQQYQGFDKWDQLQSDSEKDQDEDEEDDDVDNENFGYAQLSQGSEDFEELDNEQIEENDGVIDEEQQKKIEGLCCYYFSESNI